MTRYKTIETDSLIATLLDTGADENTAIAGALWLKSAVSYIKGKKQTPEDAKALREAISHLKKAAKLASQVDCDLQRIIETRGLGAAQFVADRPQRAHGALAAVLFRWAREFGLPETLSTSSLLVRIFSTLTGQDVSVAVKTLQSLRLEENT